MTLMQLVQGFWGHLTGRRKQQLAILLILMILASFAEVLSLGAVLPFLGVLTQPEKVLLYPRAQPILSWLGIDKSQDLLLPVTVAFITAALLAGSMRLVLLYVQTKLSFSIGADFSRQIYRRTLYQPYTVHVSRNSSEVISGATTKVHDVIFNFLMPVVTLISSGIMLLAILAALLAVDPKMSLVAFLGFGLIYGIVIMLTRKRLAIYSLLVARESTRVVKVLQEGLGGIREVLIEGTQETYCRLYSKADIPLRQAQAGSTIIAGSPRYAAEALGMAFIAVLAYLIAKQNSDLGSAVTLLGVLALGAQRLLPVLQQAYQSIVLLRATRDTLQDALDLLDQPLDESFHEENREHIEFSSQLRFMNLGFRYKAHQDLVLKNINLVVSRGNRIGFIGATGSGKSTFLDVVMGLLEPTCGEIWVDNIKLCTANRRAWQRLIAHVPQSIYLSDASVGENIAFGLMPEEINWDRVKLAAKRAQISDYIKSLPDGYDTKIGERGVNLSGGQRQRIGIARALYKNAKIIVLDEATSALDNQTERAVMDEIGQLSSDLTVLIIAHRLSTLQQCDFLVEISNGEIVRTGSYEEIIGDVSKQ